jgi:hypothetical protein
MKIKIRKDGFLEIERAGKMKSQFCAASRLTSRCGDWCPKFREPVPCDPSKRNSGRLELCLATWHCDVIDERKREDEK